MEAYVMVQRKKQTVVTSIRENALVSELNKHLACIFKVAPQNQKLFYKGELLENTKIITEYGVSALLNEPQNPAILVLAFRNKNGDFEDLEVTPYTIPIE